MKATMTDKELTIVLPINQRISSTGKSILVATCNAKDDSGLVVDGKPLKIGVNAYIKR